MGNAAAYRFPRSKRDESYDFSFSGLKTAVMREFRQGALDVLVSTTAVYGAWDNNPVPITEDDLVRPNPGFEPATHAAEIERRVRAWQAEHPNITWIGWGIARTPPSNRGLSVSWVG